MRISLQIPILNISLTEYICIQRIFSFTNISPSRIFCIVFCPLKYFLFRLFPPPDYFPIKVCSLYNHVTYDTRFLLPSISPQQIISLAKYVSLQKNAFLTRTRVFIYLVFLLALMYYFIMYFRLLAYFLILHTSHPQCFPTTDNLSTSAYFPLQSIFPTGVSFPLKIIYPFHVFPHCNLDQYCFNEIFYLQRSYQFQICSIPDYLTLQCFFPYPNEQILTPDFNLLNRYSLNDKFSIISFSHS